LFRSGVVVDFAVGHVALAQRRMFYDVFVGRFELQEKKRVVYRVTFSGRFRSVLIRPTTRRVDDVYLEEGSDPFLEVFLGQRLGGGGVKIDHASVFPVHEKRLVCKLVDVRPAVDELTVSVIFRLLGPRLQFRRLYLQ